MGGLRCKVGLNVKVNLLTVKGNYRPKELANITSLTETCHKGF